MRVANPRKLRSLAAVLAAGAALFWLSTSPSPAAPLDVPGLTSTLGSTGLSLGQELTKNLDAVKDDDLYKPVKDLKTSTDAEKDAFRTALLASWKKQVEPVIDKLTDALVKKRGDLLGQTDAANPRIAALSTSLQNQKDAIGKTLKDTLTLENAGLAKFDPGANDDATKTKAADAFKKYKEKLVTTFGEAWGRASKEIIASFESTGTPSANDRVAANQARVEKILADNEEDRLTELTKQTGFSQVVRCIYGQTAPGLACKPGVRLSGAEVSEIVISGLPTDKAITITAYAADEVEPDAPSDSVLHPGHQVRFGCPPPKDGTNPRIALSCDQAQFEEGSSDQIIIALYKGRALFPKYGGIMASTAAAATQIRGISREDWRIAHENLSKSRKALGVVSAEAWEQFLRETQSSQQTRKGLSILASGANAQIYVQVKVEDPNGGPPRIASTSIPIGYERWSLETGGFFAISRLTDKSLVQEPSSDGFVKVLRVTNTTGYAQESGVFLNFIPRNYPLLGMGIGFSTDSSRPLSTYAGPSLRLRGFGQRAVANLSAGMAMRSIKRFPGIHEGKEYKATSPLLNGNQEYHIKPFVLLQLGFSFGPIPGPDDNNKKTSN